jgi:hypothetical protein
LELLPDVLEPEFEELSYVLVVERVEGELAVAAMAHESHLPELAQVVRNGGLARANRGGQVTDAELATSQSPHDLKASGVGQNLERVRDKGKLVFAAER